MVDDVELCLEIQVDPDSKKILSNPEKCHSTLLDVTVLKPKEMDGFGTQKTNTLTAAEVRKLITSLEKQRRKKQKVLDKLKFDNTIIQVRKHEDCFNSSRKAFPKHKEKSPGDDFERKDFIGISESVEPLFCEIKRSLKNVETRISSMKDINLVISQTTVDESASETFVSSRRRRQTKFTTYNDLKNPCIYRSETTPPDLKSVLVCGKKSKFEHGDKVQGKCLCENCGIVGLLLECQKHRIMSELNTSPAPSAHYRKIRNRKTKTRFHMSSGNSSNTKIFEDPYVMQLTQRMKFLEHRLAQHEEKLVPKDYFKKVLSKVVQKDLKSKNSDVSFKPYENSRKKEDVKETTTLIKTDKSTLTNEEVSDEYTWKWGEEILKPGIDLKNRIVTLLNDILCKFALREKCPIENTPEKNDEINSDTFRKLMDQINTKVFVGRAETEGQFLSENFSTNYKDYGNKPVAKERKNSEGVHEKMKTLRESPVRKENVKQIDVAYVNPKISEWQKDSHSIIKGKEEFLRIVSKAKQHQKDILWKNIWSQAKANGQKKRDKLTIKIPVQNNGKKEMLETEMTIGEVEVILKDRF